MLSIIAHNTSEPSIHTGIFWEAFYNRVFARSAARESDIIALGRGIWDGGGYLMHHNFLTASQVFLEHRVTNCPGLPQGKWGSGVVYSAVKFFNNKTG